MAEWIPLDDCMALCSNCNSLGCGSNYCPNCGARMDGKVTGERITTGLFDKEELYPNCTVQIWKNTKTGEYSLGWWENEE